jgi:hypothetical protein
MAAFYPWSVAGPLGQVPEETSNSSSGPGYAEFDMIAITKSPSALQPQPLSSPQPARTHNSTSSTIAATTFSTTPNFNPTSAIPRPLPAPRPQATSSRPRPVSMPPQAFSTPTPTSSSDRDRQQTADSKHGQIRHGSTSKSRSSNRILGDYTLTKTLGAGSMGKVKLAIHNVTDEKVRATCHVKRKRRSDQHWLFFAARRQNPSSGVPPAYPAKWFKCQPGSSREAGLEGCFQRDTYSPRGSTLHASPSPIHLWHA